MIKPNRVVDLLLYVIAFLAFVPLIGEAGIVYEALFVCIILFSALKKVRVPRFMLNALSVAVILFTVSRMSMDNMVVPALQALMFITAIKFLEAERRFRDYMQVYMLATFMLAGSALIDLSIWFLVYAVAIFMLVSVSMVLLTYMTEDGGAALPVSTVRTIVFKTLAIPLISIPVAVLLFAVLPRTNYPVFDFLNREDGVSVGFSDSVALGNVSDIQQDSRLIFRAETPEIRGGAVYWRGIVMDSFDGRVWSASTDRERRTRINRPASLTEQKIYLEPYGDRYLFGLDAPYHMDIRGSERGNGFVYSLSRPVQRRIQYTAYSSYEKYLREDYESYDKFLELPELSAELAAFADSFEDMEAEELAGLLEVYFIRNGFEYSLTKLPVSDTPLEDFLFRVRSGNCEYYASAAAVVLRRKGVPARLAGGYSGGYYNAAGGYYAVPQRNAHVWVEAYIEGKGWLRVEPTPAAASAFAQGGRGLAFRMRMLADTVNFYWNAFVINYDFSKQVQAVRSIGSAFDNVKNDYKAIGAKAFRLAPFAVCLLLVFALYRFRTLFKRADDAKYAAKFRKLMTKKGFAHPQGAGLTEIDISDGRLKELADEYISLFQGAFYRGRTLTKEEKTRLKDLLKEMKRLD